MDLTTLFSRSKNIKGSKEDVFIRTQIHYLHIFGVKLIIIIIIIIMTCPRKFA